MAIFVTVAFLSAAGLADDISAPTYRGQDGSTTQEWDFVTSGQTSGYYPQPDGTGGITDNDYGTPYATVSGGSYDADDDAWYDFTQLSFFVPNTGDYGAETWKDMRVQVTFHDDSGNDTPPEISMGADNEIWASQTGSVVSASGNWMCYIQDWHADENPSTETVVVGIPDGVGTGYGVSQVVIDTICLPEPTSLALIAIGSLALLKRRR